MRTNRLSHDVHGTPLVRLDDGSKKDSAFHEAKAKAKHSKRLANSKLAVRVEKEDCWKIGEEGVEWEEPEGTSRSNYDM